MTPLPLTVGIVSFASTALAYVVVLALVVPLNPGTPQGNRFVAALSVTAAWGAGVAIVVGLRGFAAWLPALDAVHGAAWALYVATLLKSESQAAAGMRVGSLLALAALVLGVAVVVLAAMGGASEDPQSLLIAMLALSLVGLLSLEQLFRNAVLEERRVLLPLAIGVGAAFAVDVFAYAEALLFRQMSWGLWQLRGFVNAATAPLLVLAAKRQMSWGRELFVSRQVVFYTTSLVAAGLYLVAMAAGGILISARGVAWGLPLQILFFLCAGAVLLYALLSASVRGRLKIFIAKHFYSNRYDYREEWLRLIETLAAQNGELSLPERVVKALADIIGSSRGELWLVDTTGSTYEPHGVWRARGARAAIPRSDMLVRFLERTRWVIDTQEYRADPEKYANAFAADGRWVASPAVFVPLMHAGVLVGIVRLERPSALGKLSFEDHDLLKTAGQQAAIFLAQERAQEQLSETRQFEAFSRLTAFLMHDLKNLIAQQELVVSNAQRFKHRPEFIEDAVRTIESGVQRMKRVLERLQGSGGNDRTALVDVDKLVQEVCAACADRQPAPRFGGAGASARVAIDRDKLAMALTHAVRNAQDATPPGGRLDVRLRTEDGRACIEVDDGGVGMDAKFIRDHLFKPFDSTKGAKGMGIGAYQIRETLRAAGGDVEVRSEPGKGTLVTMSLPLAVADILEAACE